MRDLTAPSPWAVIVHGGAKAIKPELLERNRAGCGRAAEAAAHLLAEGGTAVAAAEAAVRHLEDDPVFNAGFGSVLTSDGTVEMDAAIMDGSTLQVGGVANVRRLLNPVSVAAAMLATREVLIAGEGAERFALNNGFELCDPGAMVSPEALASEAAHDTVGCVVLDTMGHLAAATSTGGLPGKHPGRIGDSPILGCGLYADDQRGAVSLSGEGESIMRLTLAAQVMRLLESHGPVEAAERAIAMLARVGGDAGAIVISRDGRFGIAHNSPHFAVALHGSWLEHPVAATHASELGGVL
jgi:beta-aspartyl-peptidase (threonine type)